MSKDTPISLKDKLSTYVTGKLESNPGSQTAGPSPPSTQPDNCRPGCPVCSGVGLVRYEVPLDDFRFGKLFPCPNMPLEKLHHEGHFGLCWDEQKALDWDDVVGFNGVKEAFNAVRQALAHGWGWVYLWGEYATAKSHLLKTAVAEHVRTQKNAYYTRMVDLMDSLRAAYDEDQASRALQERMNYFTGVPLLALDEIDRVKHTKWVQERIFQLLDRRYNAALLEHSVTLIASNCRPENLDRYLSGRRVLDGRFAVVHLDGVDMRPVMDGAK